MNHLQRFIAVMDYQPVDRVPNWELGVWPQTRDRWEPEGLTPGNFIGIGLRVRPSLGMAPREFIRFRPDMIPSFDPETL